MKPIIIGIFILLFLPVAQAQPDLDISSEITRLRGLAQKAPNDSLRLEFATKAAQKYRFVEVDSAKLLLKQLIKEHKTLPVNPISHAFAYNVLGDIYRLEPNEDSAKRYYEEAYNWFKEHSPNQGFLSVAPTAGHFFIQHEESERGIRMFQEAIDLGIKQENHLRLSVIYGNLGHVFYSKLKDRTRAKELYLKGREACAKVENNPENKTRVSASIDVALSHIYLEEENLDSAIICAKRGVQLAEEMRMFQKVIVGYNVLCQCYLDLNDYEQARLCHESARELTPKVKDLEARIQTEIHTQALLLLEGKFAFSIKQGEKILATYLGKLDHQMKTQVFDYLSTSYWNMGNSRKSLAAKDSLLAHMQATLHYQQEELIAKMYDDFLTREQVAKNELLTSKKEETEKRLRTQKVAVAAMMFALLFVIAWLVTVYQAYQERKVHNLQLEKTVQKRTQELEAANEALKQTNYELRTLTFLASHDIKEPIRNISSFVGLIKRRMPEEIRGNFEEEFRFIHDNSQQLYRLMEDVNRYLKLSKTEKFPLTQIQLSGFLESVRKEILSSSSSGQIEIAFSGMPVIRSNETALSVVLTHLIENGVKFNHSAQPIVRVSHHEDAHSIQIMVEDNGIGIPEAYREKIFHMFVRLHPRSDYLGSGIGLAMSRMLVEKLGGTLQCVPPLTEKGSRFVITFPKNQTNI